MENMKSLLLERLPDQGIEATGVKGVAIFRRDMPYDRRPQLYHPQIIFLAQGKKNIYLGDEAYTYDARHYYVQTVPLPVDCEAVIENGEPMLGLVIQLDPQLIGEILFETERTPVPPRPGASSLYDAEIPPPIHDALTRLLVAMKDPEDERILGPLYLKEILYLVIKEDKGQVLRELAVNNRGFYQISRVLNQIHQDYAKRIEVPELARKAGMSASAFHASFRDMTSTSPLQYIKNVRLHKARELIQQEGEKANSAAALVGYESTSQFSREYKRCFGVSPSQDRLPDETQLKPLKVSAAGTRYGSGTEKLLAPSTP